MASHRDTARRSWATRLRKGLGACVAVVSVVVAAPGAGSHQPPDALLFAPASDPAAAPQALDAADIPADRVLIFSEVRAEALSWEIDGDTVSASDADVAVPVTTPRGPVLFLDAAALDPGTHTVSATYPQPNGGERVLVSTFQVRAPEPQADPPSPSPGATPSPEPPEAPPAVPAPLPEPAPAPAPPPAPAPAPAPVVVPAPSAWPSSASTGPRDGHSLVASGPLVITEPGAVVADLDVDGCIDVQAPNVTITDVRVSCARSTTAIRIHDGASATIAYVEIEGNGVVSTAVGFSDYTLSHVDIHGVIDGPRVNSNVQILDSYVHDLARTSDSHNDAIQTTGGTGIVIRGNNLQAYSAAADDPMNAALMIGSENAPLRDMLVENNLVNGGNYSILAREDLNGRNIVVRGNHFGRDFRYGPYRGVPAMDADSSNVWADTLRPIF